jgi:hypothetical protein
MPPMSDSFELPVDQANFAGTTEAFKAGSVDDLAAESSLDGRFQKDAILQYQYAPAIGRTPGLTSVARQLSDGSTVADVTISFTPKKGSLYEVEFSVTGADPELYANLRESPLRLYNKPTNLSVRARLRTRHPVSGLEGDWSPYATITTAQDTTAPSPGSTPSAVPVVGDGTQMTVTWGASPSGDARSYDLFRSGGQILSGTLGLTHNDTGLSLGTQYFYQNRAIDRSGNVGGFSAQGFGITANEAAVDAELGTQGAVTLVYNTWVTLASDAFTMLNSTGGRRVVAAAVVQAMNLPFAYSFWLRLAFSTGQFSPDAVGFGYGVFAVNQTFTTGLVLSNGQIPVGARSVSIQAFLGTFAGGTQPQLRVNSLSSARAVV